MIHLESAIKNVGLLADNAWATSYLEKEYKQRNQDLWIKFNEAEELGKDSNSPEGSQSNVETVNDRIPQSRLASYGDFTYDKNEELFYRSYNDDNLEPHEKLIQTDHSEFWLCPEVEQEFRRITCPIPIRSNKQHQNKMKSASLEDQPLQSLQTTVNLAPSQWLQNQPWPSYLLHYYPNLSDSLSSSNKSFFSQGLSTQPN